MYKFCSETPVIPPQISSAYGVTMCSVLQTNTANTWRVNGKFWLLQDHSFLCWGIIPYASEWFSFWTFLHWASLLLFHEEDIIEDGNQKIFSIFHIESMNKMHASNVLLQSVCQNLHRTQGTVYSGSVCHLLSEQRWRKVKQHWSYQVR